MSCKLTIDNLWESDWAVKELEDLAWPVNPLLFFSQCRNQPGFNDVPQPLSQVRSPLDYALVGPLSSPNSLPEVTLHYTLLLGIYFSIVLGTYSEDISTSVLDTYSEYLSTTVLDTILSIYLPVL